MDVLIKIVDALIDNLKKSELKEKEISKVVMLTSKIEEDVTYMLKSEDLTLNQKNCF